MNDKFISKSEARAYFSALRSSIPEITRKEKSKVICSTVLSLPLFSKCDTLFLYAPIKSEVDVYPLFKEATSQGIKVAFPISIKESSTLDFRFVSNENELVLGAYSIREPRADLPKASFTENSICIVPALSFDKSGGRLGYGKGFYDRFLSQFDGTSIGVTFSELKCDALPTDEFDIPVNIIITDKESVKTK